MKYYNLTAGKARRSYDRKRTVISMDVWWEMQRQFEADVV
jgi:hypothetical protein